jgi:hypothetical protein
VPHAPSAPARPRSPRAPQQPRRRSRGRTIAIVVGVVLAVLVALSAAAFFLAPPALTNLSSEVTTADTTVSANDGTVSATAPAGWVVQHPFLHDDELVLRSPDGRLTLTITGSPLPVDAAFAALAASDADLGPVVTETLASGLSARHAETGGGTRVVAAVGGAGRSAAVVATVDAPDPSAYRPAIAGILESIGVSS